MPRKLLLIAFDFPPRRTSGVYRAAGLVRHLSKLGWKITVLTVREKEGETRDPELLKKVPPQVRVVRTHYLRVSAWEDWALRALRRAGIVASSHSVVRATTATERPHASRLFRHLQLMARFVRTWLYFPDDAVGWVPWGLAAAVGLCFKERYDVVYTTSPPRSTPLIGLFLKLLLGVTWIAESRDPWLLPVEFGTADVFPRVRHKLMRWVNAWLVQHADMLVVVARGYAEELQTTYRLSADKITCISNGFDERDFASNGVGAATVLEPGYVHLSHIGTIYGHGSGCFFRALAELVLERPEAKQSLRVNVIGYPDDDVIRYAEDRDLRDIIRIRKFVHHGEALRVMHTSDCLLIFYANAYFSQFCVPGKLYEYLRAGRPILAISFPGEAKELIEGSGAGWVFQPDDVQGIKQALGHLLAQGRGPSLPVPRPEFVVQFRYDRLAAKLSTALEGVIRNER